MFHCHVSLPKVDLVEVFKDRAKGWRYLPWKTRKLLKASEVETLLLSNVDFLMTECKGHEAGTRSINITAMGHVRHRFGHTFHLHPSGYHLIHLFQQFD